MMENSTGSARGGRAAPGVGLGVRIGEQAERIGAVGDEICDQRARGAIARQLEVARDVVAEEIDRGLQTAAGDREDAPAARRLVPGGRRHAGRVADVTEDERAGGRRQAGDADVSADGDGIVELHGATER